MTKNKTTLATLAALFAQIIFGFSFMATKISLGYASPMTVIADRYIIAFIGLSMVMLITRTGLKMRRGIWKLVIMSVFQPLLYFVFESYGIKLTTSAFSSVMIALIPVVSMISGIFILKEIPSPMQYVFMALSVGGVVIMALSGQSDGTVTTAGIILLFGAVISSVAYNIASRKLSEEFSAFERTYAMTIIGMISFLGIALVENIHNPIAVVSCFANPGFTGAIMYLGIFSSVIAFLMLNYANTHLPVAKTTVFSNITTVVSVIAGTAFLNEPFSVEAVVSTLMIVVGVFGVQKLNVRT